MLTWESDKENSPTTPETSVDQDYKTYKLPTKVGDWAIKDAFGRSRITVIEIEDVARPRFVYIPPGPLPRHDSAVPEYLRHKMYDTRPPPPSRDQVLAAAERLASARVNPAPEHSDADADYSHNPTLTPKKRKRDGSKHTRHAKTGYSPPQVTVFAGRTMITPCKPAAKMQKLVPGFPLPQDPSPTDFTLTELCSQYPNHLFGDNLHPFLQHEWSATKIAKLLPDQSQVAVNDRVTANAIVSRLRKSKAALEKLGQYSSLMNGPKTHIELWNNL